MSETWTYVGDVGIRHGGMYWKDVDGETVDVVKVIPYRDAGGPENLFRIVSGHVDVALDEDRRRQGLSIIGVEPENATREDLLQAALQLSEQDWDYDYVVRIGAQDPFWTDNGRMPEPTVVLNGNASLRKYIAKEFLQPEPEASPAPGM